MDRRNNLKKLYVHCPVCGTQLFRSTVSDIEIRCSRCKTNFNIEIDRNHILILQKYAEAIAEAGSTAGVM